MKTRPMSARCVLGGILLGLLVALGPQSAMAQGSAPTASVSPGQPSFVAGSPAMFKGRDFVPGETVRFQITHVRGTPVTGTNHTPTAVVAGPTGDFAAIWLTCAADCVGEVLQIEATGQTSGRVARAVFIDLSPPPQQGSQAQQFGRAAGAANRRANQAQANPTQTAAAPTFDRIKSFGPPTTGAFPQGRLIQGTDGALYGTATYGGAGGAGTIFKVNPDGTGFAVLKNLDYSNTGGYPYAGLVRGTDGALYGTTYQGGASGYGTVFKLNTDGTGFTVLQNFDYFTIGGYLSGRLMQGTDGALYGTAYQGGPSGAGTVFKLSPDGTGFTVLQNFDNSTTGGYPSAGLIQGTDGALYGTAQQGGTSGTGTAFKLNADGTGFTVLQNFDYSTTGGYVNAGLMQGTDGALYGTAYQGGSMGYGTVFKLNTDGTGFTVLQNFDYYTTGGNPYAEVVQAADGALYGTTIQGGTAGWGTVFKLSTVGTGFAVLKNFDYSTTGGYPFAGLMQGADGALYGTAYQGGSNGYGNVIKLNTDGTGFTVLKNLTYGADLSAEGGYPFAPPIQGTDGALYGTAAYGGTAGYGTVFKLNADGTGFTVLRNFDYSTTGAYLQSPLMQGTDGALYGMAQQGGTFGAGTVFKLNTDGTGFTVLKNLDNASTGGYPYTGGLTQGADGALYGTAGSGGMFGYGTAFKLNADGTGFTVLQNFDNSTTGAYPYSGVVQGIDGALYGTAYYGGSGGYGTVYKLNTDGTGFTVLHGFDNGTTGGYSIGRLMQGTDGVLYGTTLQGGTGTYGTVYKLNTDGTGLAVLHDFDTSAGLYPYAGLVQGTDGALYGTTYYGGSGGIGTVYSLNPDGSDFSVLRNFDGGVDGGYPYAALARGSDGNLYGATYQGGDSGIGTLFRLVFAATNNPPVAMCKNVTVPSGAGCTAAASIDNGSNDPDAGDTITLAQSPAGPYPLGATSVTLTVTDNHGASSTCSGTVTVTNAAPVATITGPASGTVFAVDTAVPFTGTWTDANGGPHTAQWTFDGTQDASFAAGTGASGSANTSHTFTAAGVYMVSLAVTDNCGAAGTANQVGGMDAMVVVYDPDAGFVTGGGWINSPPGAYPADPTLTGKANFGFVSKYKKGANVPTGETEFQYKVGNLNFHSTSYQWLVVGGAKAQYKGSGTINGAGSYGFMLTAVDGEISGGGGQDKFRMKITGSGGLVYDNLLNAADSADPTTLLGGGSIVIHTGGGAVMANEVPGVEPGDVAAAVPAEYGLSQNYPNPFDRSTRIAFALPERSRLSLAVFDLAGREVRSLAEGEWAPGRHAVTFDRTAGDGQKLGAGIYWVRMNAVSVASGQTFQSLRKMVLMQ